MPDIIIPPVSSSDWVVYILELKDGTLYTGITNNLKNRLEKHSTGRGSKYVRGRLPFKLMYLELQPNKSKALKREAQIKKYNKSKKLKLINNFMIL